MTMYPLDPAEAETAAQAGYAASREHLGAAPEGVPRPAETTQQPFDYEQPGEPPEPGEAPGYGGVT